MFHLCSHILIFVAKCDAQLKAWDISLVLTSVAGNLCNKCPSSYSNKTAVKVILLMRSLVSIEQQSPRRPCDIYLNHPPCTHPLCTFFNQVLHMWYMVFMPGFTPTPAIYNKLQFNFKLHNPLTLKKCSQIKNGH